MKKIGLIIVLISLNNLVAAQDYTQTVRGKVTDSQTDFPLIGVTVEILNSNSRLGAQTDAMGDFRIENVPVGRIGIRFTTVGYFTYEQDNISVSSNKEVILNIKLDESVVNLNEVIVSGQYKKAETINPIATVSARSFSIEETERYSGSIGDPARMASNFAGVSTICDQRNDIVIRGNSPLGVLWRLDGIDIPNPNHFSSFGASGGPISILNNNLLTNSDFFSGAFPAEYGNALSGVFDLKMREGNNEKREYVVQAGMNGFEIGAEGPFIHSHSSYLINYRYSTLAFVDALGFNVGIDAIPFFQDASFKLTSGYTKYGKFSLIGIGGYSHVNEFESKLDTSRLQHKEFGTDHTYGTGMGVIGLLHNFLLNRKTKLENSINISYTLSRIEDDTFSIVRPEPAMYYKQLSDEKGLTLRSQIKHKFNTKNIIHAGISFQTLRFQFVDSIRTGAGFKTIMNEKGHYGLLKSFIQYQYKFNDNTVFYGGLNYLLFTFNNSSSLEPRLGFSRNFSNHHSVHLGAGLHGQLPPRLYFLVQSETNTGQPDEFNQNLQFSKSAHFVFAYNYSITENLRMKLETYYQYLFNIPVKEGFPQYSMLNFGADYFSQLPVIDSLINKGTGKNYGVELTIEKFLDKGYYGLLTGTLYESYYCGYDGIERNTAFNGNFILNLLAGKVFKIGNKNSLSIDAKMAYAGSIRFVPFEVVKVSDHNYFRYYDWDRAYENRRNNYFRINLRVGYKLNMKKFSLETAVDFMNVTNHKDIFNEYFDSETGVVSYSYQFSFLPIGILRFTF